MSHVFILTLAVMTACVAGQPPTKPLGDGPALAPPAMVQPTLVPTPTFSVLKSANKSTVYLIEGVEGYGAAAPLLLTTSGTHYQIGYDYAALLHTESSYLFHTFMDHLLPNTTQQAQLFQFVDYLWDTFLMPHTPQEFLDELDGMDQWYADNGGAPPSSEISSRLVSSRFYTLANLPADGVNVIAMLEQELEQGWPQWLKDIINEIIKILEKMVKSCDAIAVWGNRTVGGQLYSTRNLDYNSNTGMNRYKLVTVFHVNDPKYGGVPPGGPYATMGFAFGYGALAGMSSAGITTSEMNLDNSVVTFSGVPFPLRLRYVLERATDLHSAMSTWDATNNTNSFNFLIASGGERAAYALETIMGFTAVFPANSPIERNATYFCKPNKCKGWSNRTGNVSIGRPLPEAVWRTNHGMDPRVMATQESLFNDTVFRYDLMHDLVAGLEAAGVLIGDVEAAGIVATLGTKGDNFLTCDQPLTGDNVLSVLYAPAAKYFYVAWESGGVGSADQWRPAACSPYVKIDLTKWF